MSRLYINLPVENLEKSIEFYTAIGFTQNLAFTDDSASAMNYGDEFTIMLLTHGFAMKYIGSKKIANAHETTELLSALQFDSRAEVDAFFEKAIAA
jgi:uncharacterized protein